MPRASRARLRLRALGRCAPLVFMLGFAACRDTHAEVTATTVVPDGAAGYGGPIAPLPATLPTDPAKVALGRRLFSERALSGDGTHSCASCHDLQSGGDDGRRFSIGVGGATGTVNAPTVLNAALNFAQFWDGRAATLEDQALVPVENAVEMASTWPAVVQRLSRDATYVREYREVFRAPISARNTAAALAEYQRTLLTPGGPFDRWLAGDSAALEPDARNGYALFQDLGCVACHQGRGVGGNMYQYFGVMGDYFRDRGNETTADQGRFNVTGVEGDRHLFKVPSLRNVAQTAPYFHDGSAATLDDAVTIMARYQLGRRLGADERRLLVAFLRSLSGPAPQVVAGNAR